MKKLILAVLIAVMIATPCFAQDVEPDSLFSIEGTQWKMLPIMMMILPFPFIITLPPLPSLYPEPDYELPTWGFYGGKVYYYNYLCETSFYADMLVASIFMSQHQPDPQAGDYGYALTLGVLQPTGIGMITIGSWIHGLAVALVIKINDNWIPPEIE